MGTATIRVPAAYIRQQRIDYDGEIFAVMDRPLRLGGLSVPPPPLGVFTLLEVIESDFYREPLDCGLEALAAALVIATRREHAVEPVNAWRNGNPEPLQSAARELIRVHGDSLTSDLAGLINHILVLPFNGFQMIPAGPGGYQSEYIYGADTVASIASLICSKLNMSFFDALWRCPMCLAGHLAAQAARDNGKEGVARPKDRDDVKLQIKLAYEREERGELHPWQIEFPDLHRPTALQLAVNPDIVKQHRELLKEKAAGTPRNPGQKKKS